MTIFENRRDAGKQLAKELSEFKGQNDAIVLGLPRGGIPVAYEVAKALELPLDVFIVRKLGVPGQPELAMGAIASGDIKVMNESVVRNAGISDQQIEEVAHKEKEELKKREKAYRGARPDIDLQGKTVLIVDDGLATGASMRAAISALREHNPKKIIAAIPTAPRDTCQEFESEVDQIICLRTPSPFWGVGGSYQNFSQTTNEEVRTFLNKAQ